MIGLMLFLVIVPGAIGDILNSAGMKRHGEITAWGLSDLAGHGLNMATNVYVLAGIPAMAVAFFALMALLSATAMSFAVPLTASSYVIETAMAKYLLHEQISWHRWIGTVLVTVGVAVLAS